MTERINEAIEVFLKAIEVGSLAKGNCAACAVGNLVAHGMIEKESDIIITNPLNYEESLSEVKEVCFDDEDLGRVSSQNWSALFCTMVDGNQHIRRALYLEQIEAGLKVISYTKFTEEELAKIEYAFETNTEIGWSQYNYYTKEQIRQDQMRGLEAVVQVMLDFDDCKELVSEVFTKRAELIPV